MTPFFSTFNAASVRGVGRAVGRAAATGGPAPTGPAPTGTFNILLASYDTSGWVNDVAVNLTTAAVKYSGLSLNISQAVDLRTLPTISVGQYDAILFWSDGGLNWNSSFDTHNANNGGLVTTQFYASTGTAGITAGLMPTVNQSGGQSGGAITWPAGPYNHPIANGYDSNTQKVSNFVTGGDGFAAINPTLNSGATTVITATQGVTRPFVIVKDNAAPTGRTVFLNMFPPSNGVNSYSGGWSMSTYPDGALLMLNALLWSARKL